MEHDTRLLETKARSLAEAGRLDEAIAVYREIVGYCPEHAEAWLSLGELQAECGAVREGLASITRSITLDPENCEAWLSAGPFP